MTGGYALILGSTGRNLGAGMSGGYAYVLDLNVALVNQAAMSSGELELSALTYDDAAFVYELLATHVTETGSLYATALLDDWSMTRNRITAITPRDFRKVTIIRNAALDAGSDPDSDGVWAEIMEVTGG